MGRVKRGLFKAPPRPPHTHYNRSRRDALTETWLLRRMQRAMADYQAGRAPNPNDFGTDDLPEGMATLYLLYGVAGYCFICCVCHPARVSFATATAGIALLCGHFIK